MKQEHGIRFNVDYASDYRLSGWALDPVTGLFPENLELRAENGIRFQLAQSTRIDRGDVRGEFGLEDAVFLGFEINLLDVFNDRLSEFSLHSNGRQIWSHAEHLAKLSRTVAEGEVPLADHAGARQVVVIYGEGGWLHQMLRQIHAWSPTYFHKAYQASVSFSFLPAGQLGARKDGMLKSVSSSFLFVDRAVYRTVLGISPTLANSCSLVLLDEALDLDFDFNGIASVISMLSNVPDRTRFKADTLLRYLTALSGYQNLLFERSLDLFSFHSGTPRPWMKDFMSRHIQSRIKDDVVILASKPVRRLRDLDQEECAVFVRTGSLGFLLDATRLPAREFLEAAYKRGGRVKVVVEGELA